MVTRTAKKKTAKKKTAKKKTAKAKTNGAAKKRVSRAPNGKPRRPAEKNRDLQNTRLTDMPAGIKHSSKTKEPTVDKASSKRLEIEDIEVRKLQLTFIGPHAMTNRFSEADLDKIEKDQTSEVRTKKTKAELPPRKPIEEFLHHCHICEGKYMMSWHEKGKNTYGFPAVGIKKGFAQVCHKLGLSANMIDIIRFMFVHGPYEGLIPFLHKNGKPVQPRMQRDAVYLKDAKKGRIATPAYRPVFENWQMTVQVEYLPMLISKESVVKGFELAGRFIGLGSWTNERGGIYGGYTVDPKVIELPPDFQFENIR